MKEGVKPHLREAIREKLVQLYGEVLSYATFERLSNLIEDFPEPPQSSQLALSERDVLVIAYGDHVQRANEHPLATLRQVLKAIDLPVSGVHVLPFYPYSSDDGFSVIDYFQVDPALGNWDDIRALSADFRVMFDAVFNHISAQSSWFQAFLRSDPTYLRYFITADPETDLSLVTRPRTLPLLTPFDTNTGRKYVWTTFSEDQVDLDFSNPDVLLDVLTVLMFYIEQGAQLIRLDAIAFMWKRIGTTSIHLPETHLIIQLMRDLLDIVAPDTLLVTETNVPHQENISYFGDGQNEAQMVYQFPLPPLIMHTLHTGDATRLTTWAQTVERVSDRTTYFNFTASHDGIGMRPVTGILSDGEIAALVERTQAHGGFVSYKNNADGTQSPYELNITYFDAITHPDVTAADPQTAIHRFIVSQAVMLSFVGVPGVYMHSLFGSRNDLAGVETTGRYRTINREKLNADVLLAELADPSALSAQVFARYQRLLKVRTAEPAFHPLGGQTVLDLDPQVFAVERTSPNGSARVLALHNISGASVTLSLPVSGSWVSLFDDAPVDVSASLTLSPYQVLWLKAE